MRNLTLSTLRDWPLPDIDGAADKEDRGQVLIIAGSREIPGAAMLAATAALRAGAGKLTIATVSSIAPGLALAMPEARVIGLPETDTSGLRAEGAQSLVCLAANTRAVLIGPGLSDESGSAAFLAAALDIFKDSKVILDALAMDAVLHAPDLPAALLLTPHAGEMAHLTGLAKDVVQQDPPRVAQQFAQRYRVSVALKGPVTFIANPPAADEYAAAPSIVASGRRTASDRESRVHLSPEGWRHTSTHPGLGTSGSGDVLAGLIAGLAARGATLEQAAVWGVSVHAQAGGALSKKVGSLGFLARELLVEIPKLLQRHALNNPG